MNCSRRRAFSHDNQHLLFASIGHGGVAIARRHLPDVIVMDNNMPILSGREACAILQRDPRTAGIPVIALSADAMPEAIADGLAGYFHHLTKPIDLSALREAIDIALKQDVNPQCHARRAHVRQRPQMLIGTPPRLRSKRYAECLGAGVRLTGRREF